MKNKAKLCFAAMILMSACAKEQTFVTEEPIEITGVTITAAPFLYTLTRMTANGGLSRLIDKSRCVLNGGTKQAFVWLHVAEEDEAEVFVRRATEAA